MSKGQMQLSTEQIPNVLHTGDPNRANKLLISLMLGTGQTQLINLQSLKRWAHTLHKVFIWRKKKKEENEEKRAVLPSSSHIVVL